jgi:hypothetical protein
MSRNRIMKGRGRVKPAETDQGPFAAFYRDMDMPSGKPGCGGMCLAFAAKTNGAKS